MSAPGTQTNIQLKVAMGAGAPEKARRAEIAVAPRLVQLERPKGGDRKCCFAAVL